MTTKLTTERVEEILAGCEGVTPGPWEDDMTDVLFADRQLSGFRTLLKVIDREDDASLLTAVHIARLDPQTVASLATELLALRKRVADERRRAIAAIYWVFRADGTKGEMSMAQEAIHKINDPTFMPLPIPKEPS